MLPPTHSLLCHEDSLRVCKFSALTVISQLQEFESVFCGKTGRRLKLTRPDSLVARPAQESLQSSPAMDVK